jgi:hypothetical protein
VMMNITPNMPNAGSMIVSRGKFASWKTDGEGTGVVLVGKGSAGDDADVKRAEVTVVVARKTL